MRKVMRPFPRDAGLSDKEFQLLKKLNTPPKIQDFLDRMPINFEERGETYMSVARVLRTKKAHCFEGALVAACALWMQGQRPLLLDFKTHQDEDHLVAPFKQGGLWGAVSKTNHMVLRYRDPVYRTLRELALSYFHEYFNKRGKKSLRSFASFSLLRYQPEKWISGEKELFDIVEDIENTRHHPLLPKSALKHLRNADSFVHKVSDITEYQR